MKWFAIIAATAAAVVLLKCDTGSVGPDGLPYEKPVVFYTRPYNNLTVAGDSITISGSVSHAMPERWVLTVNQDTLAFDDTSWSITVRLRRELTGFMIVLVDTLDDVVLHSDSVTVIKAFPPDAPADLRIERRENNAYLLRWRDRAEDEDGFIVWFSSESTVFSVLDTLPANTREYLDTIHNEVCERLYYRVEAFNIGGASSTPLSIADPQCE